VRGDNLKIGSTVWIFDENRRVYPKDKSGGSGPIYREHFSPEIIDGETRTSWLIRSKHWRKADWIRINKKNPQCCVSIEEVDEQCWAQEHRYKIMQLAQTADYKTLRKIAELVGYEAEPANAKKATKGAAHEQSARALS
jgi:hypothetical protein